MKIGTTTIADLKLGSQDINKVYAGSSLVWGRNGNGGNQAVPIGITLNKSTWVNVDEFFMGSLEYSLSGGKLTISGGGGTLLTGNYARRYAPELDCDEKVTITMEYKLLATGAGIAITRVPFVNQDLWVNYTGYANHSTGKAVIGGSEGSVITNTVGHFYKLELKIFQFTHTVTLTNITTAETSTTNIITGGVTSFMGFGSLGGQYEISSYVVDRQSLKYSNVICLGDSKTKHGDAVDRFAKLLEGMDRTVEVWAGGGDRTGELKFSVPLIAAALPATVIVCMGRNDLQGIPEATWKANYASSISQLKAANIQVVHLLPIPEYNIDQTPLKDYINTTYPSDIRIDPSIGWSNATMLMGDQIHPNASGHTHIANTIKTVMNWA
jgi:lysophospholipase L1-like esterase